MVDEPFEKNDPPQGPHLNSPQIKVDFDGTSFSLDHKPSNLFDAIPLLYMCNKARFGDEAAIELLTNANIAITDSSGVQYWPITKEEEKENGEN